MTLSYLNRTIALISCVTLLALGADGVRQDPKTAAANAPEDCRTYSLNDLRVTHTVNWTVWAGSPSRSGAAQPLGAFEKERDATNALALAKRYAALCWIGRRSAVDHKRPNPYDYTVTYWKSPSGRATVISSEKCVGYDPHRLRLVDQGADGWLVTNGASFHVKLDNRDDASTALTLAARYSAYCTIGRAVYEPTRKLSRFDYWK
jgi:hypothetical protein